MSANNTQVGGTHYTDMPIQPWDFMQSCMSHEQFAGYLLGNVIKYAARHQAKGGVEDLRKARHYLDKLIETKEVMRSVGDATEERPVATPAASESAAGDWPGPDWSQAPEWAMWWAVAENNIGQWFDNKPITTKAASVGSWGRTGPNQPFSLAPSFNYPGYWRDSLRRRP